jgi:cbb3-type cytochrome oxidase subunit 3
METMDGVEIYPIISILIFFTFFVGVGIYAVRARKKHVDKMSNLPLE